MFHCFLVIKPIKIRVDFKFRLLKESNNFPAIAVGLRDVAGTAVFSSEYLVASKKFLDFDLLLVWVGGQCQKTLY